MWWTLLLIITIVLLAAYTALIEKYRNWFLAIKPFEGLLPHEPVTHFSVVVPARNEERNLRRFLPMMLEQQYPAGRFEVLVVDDHSTDRTAQVVREMQRRYRNLRLISLADEMAGGAINSYKKKAIEIAIAKSNGEWIVTTDADCMVPAGWLQTIDALIAKEKPVFVAAPVKFINDGSFLANFQTLDFLSLQGITAASVHHNFHTMCNGANLAYKKSVFYEVNGFEGIDNIASGDDMLLMHKVYRQYPQGIQYLLAQAAIVQTLPMDNWSSFFNQRIRWASKATSYNDRRIVGVLALVYFTNLAMLVVLVAAFWRPTLVISWILLLLAKITIEMRLMLPVATFYGEEKTLKWFGAMQPVHILYTVVSGFLGRFGSYRWKGRKVK